LVIALKIRSHALLERRSVGKRQRRRNDSPIIDFIYSLILRLALRRSRKEKPLNGLFQAA
jgi:hypothetical protein